MTVQGARQYAVVSQLHCVQYLESQEKIACVVTLNKSHYNDIKKGENNRLYEDGHRGRLRIGP